MKIEELRVHDGPIRKSRGRRVFPEGLIIRQPDSTAKLPVCTEDKKLVLEQILPPMRVVGK